MEMAGVPKSSEFPELIDECKSCISDSNRRNVGDSLLLSGGLDTSIIAHVVSQERKIKCYTVFFPYGRTPDIYYARSMARKLGLAWKAVKLPVSKLQERLADTIRILKTFDPMEIRNSVAVFHGLSLAHSEGFTKVMTGDAADELFAGYSFTFNLEPAEMMRRLRELWQVMHFSSQPMANALGIAASLPYLDQKVFEFAKRLTPGHLIGFKRGRKYGKYILRIAFEGVIGKMHAWRVKTPIEFGSGTTSLTKYYSEKISDNAFLQSKREISERDGVKIRDKENLQYYRLFRTVYSPPGETATKQFRCPECGADAREDSTFCTTCGAYPIRTVEFR